MDETIRSFIALELPHAVKQQIGRLQEAFEKNGVQARWVKRDNIHLTLHFFGDIDTARIDPIRQAMAEAAADCGPIRIAARSVGVFPGIRNPRVVWTGVAGELDSLRNLQQRLAAALDRAGFPLPRRRFKAHLTIGRFKRPPVPDKLAEAIAAQGGFASQPFDVLQLILFQSRLAPAGAIYTKIHETPLEAGPSGPRPATVDGRTK